jgi:hypothetical protein
VLHRFQVSPDEAGVTGIHNVAFGVSIRLEHHCSWVGQFDLDQYARAAFTIHIRTMPKGGGFDANLTQSPLVDFQGLERLESGLLELC